MEYLMVAAPDFEPTGNPSLISGRVKVGALRRVRHGRQVVNDSRETCHGMERGVSLWACSFGKIAKIGKVNQGDFLQGNLEGLGAAGSTSGRRGLARC
jgi:hypothetical protein